MFTPYDSQAIRDAYGLFWRKKSGKRLPADLKGISFSNATTFPTRVRIRMFKELCRRHQLANPALSCYITSYLARPELKIRDRRGVVTSLSYTKAIQQLSQHLTLNFLQDLFKYARANLPESEVIERFLILTPDLLLGTPPEQLSMSVDEVVPQAEPHQGNANPLPQAIHLPSQADLNQAFSDPQQQALLLPGQVSSQQILPLGSAAPTGPTYASLAALPPSTSGTQFVLVQGHSSTPVSTVPIPPPPTTSSPTYATLTPVPVSPPDPLSGSFLASIPSSGLESTAGDDANLVQRNRHRFAQKSTPYPLPT
jgi:hypothetical protein